jgi:hypothetical protein
LASAVHPATGHPAPRRSGATPATPSKSCDPPFTVDAMGRHIYKRECF